MTEEPRMNDHADTLRDLRANLGLVTEEREALDAAIAALEAGRSAVPVAWVVIDRIVGNTVRVVTPEHSEQAREFAATDAAYFAAPAYAAAPQQPTGRSGEAGCYVHESALRLLAEGQEAVATSIYRETLGGRVYLAPQQPPPAGQASPVGVTDEADDVLRAMGLNPERFRTESGFLNPHKIIAAIKHPEDYAGLYLSQHSENVEAAPNVSEEHQAASDAMNYGAGFLVDGKRVAPYRVRAVKCPPKDAVSEPAASGDNEMECTCIVSDHCEIHFPNRTKVTLEGLDAASGEGADRD